MNHVKDLPFFKFYFCIFIHVFLCRYGLGNLQTSTLLQLTTPDEDSSVGWSDTTVDVTLLQTSNEGCGGEPTPNPNPEPSTEGKGAGYYFGS